MDKNLEKTLIDKYPSFFVDIYGDPTKTCMAFGCDFDNGWYELLDETCQKIKDALASDETFRFSQIKEKFGMMTLYYGGARGNKAIREIINEAAEESITVCEKCGTRENVKSEGKWWIFTLCGDCREQRKNNGL